MSIFWSMRFSINPVQGAGGPAGSRQVRRWALLALAAGSLLFSPASAGAEEPAPEAEIPAPARIPMTWETDLATAFGQAQVSLKPVLALFVAPRNMACARLKAGPLTDGRVQNLLRQFECVEIDAAVRGELAMQYQVRSVPALRVMEPDGRLRGGVDGYQSVSELETELADFLGGTRAGADLVAMAETITSGKIEPVQWPAALQMMVTPQGKEVIRQAVLNNSTNARAPLIVCLDDPRLAVRCGALDLLEELAGDTMSFDPWADAGSALRQEALTRWQRWALSTQAEQVVYAALTEAEFERALAELIGPDPDRSARALRILSQGAEMTVKGIVRYLEAHPGLEPGAIRRIKEVQYALVIPADSGLNPAATAHRLVWGNQDVQLQTIRQLSDCEARAMPILTDLLRSPEPLIREAVVETAFAAAGRFAVKPLQEHLENERDPDVIYAILRQLGKSPTRRSLALLETFFQHENEDLAVVAVESAAASLTGPLQEKLLPLLDDSRWRVRVAALQAFQANKGGGSSVGAAVKARLEDPDPFVRHTAVAALIKLDMRDAESDLKKAYARYPDMRGIVVSALLSLKRGLPNEYVEDLLVRDPTALLQTLDGLDAVSPASRPLLLRAAESENLDVSAAALRVLARSEKRAGADNAALVNALRGDKQDRWLTVIQEFAVDSSPASALRRAMKKRAGPTGKPESGASDEEAKVESFMRSLLARTPSAASSDSSVRSADEEAVLLAVEAIMDNPAASEAARRSAMLLLCRFGHEGAFRKAASEWDHLTPDEQAGVAGTLAYFGDAAIPLFKTALASDFEAVWQRAVQQMSDSQGGRFAPALIDRLLTPGSRLTTAMVWEHGLGSLCSDGSPVLLRRLRPVLQGGWERPDLIILGLLTLTAAKSPADQPLALNFTGHADPFVRRAAWMAVIASGDDKLASQADVIRKDTAWQVRDIIPAWLSMRRFGGRLDVYFSDDEFFERYEGLSLQGSSSGYSQPAMKPALVEVLKSMAAEDPEPWIRFRCDLALLAAGIPVDLNQVVLAGRSCARHDAVARTVEDFLNDNDSRLGRSFARLLPLLKTGAEERTPYVLPRLKERWGLDESESEPAAMSFAFAARAARPQPAVMAAVGEPERKVDRRPTEPILLVLFVTPGCQSCAAIEKDLVRMRGLYANLTVRKLNVRSPEGIQLNEALCQHFNVPAQNRAVTPAVFTAQGNLIKTELTRQALMELLERTRLNPEAGNWLKMTENEQKSARTALRERGRSFSVPVVLGAGLLDGVNPCAFATIIFLISYLRIRKRSVREIILIGSVYVAAVFVTYFVLGLGLTDLVARLSMFGWLQVWFNRLLAGALLIAAWLSARDGFRCLRGRAGDMTLQLPEAMKKGLHRVIREGTANPRYVLAAAVLGVMVSVLELACTGQVYLPTIVFMVQSNTDRLQAVLLLAVYNVAFVAPLVAVFVLAAAGMGSERAQTFMIRHMALVKFGLALLFVVLFVIFVRYGMA